METFFVQDSALDLPNCMIAVDYLSRLVLQP